MATSFDAQPTLATEVERPGPFPALHHPVWRDRHPWLVQGITTRGHDDPPFDLGLFTGASGAEVLARWELLRSASSDGVVVHARQVHGGVVRFHEAGSPALRLVEPCDGHATRSPGVTLAVATADCIPVTLIDPERRAVAILHAGWRGVVAGVLEAGLRVFAERLDAPPVVLEAHIGPAICGDCYEVGPEVHAALGLTPPPAPTPVDLRRVAADRLMRAGVSASSLSCSSWCTRCGPSPFFSHRGGDRQRQISFVGIRS